MAYKIIWSPDSLADIERIADFISRDSLFYAESTVFKIFEATQNLEAYPKSGRVVPELNQDNIREVFVFQYRIIYEIVDKSIYILTVIHGKRLIDKDII